MSFIPLKGDNGAAAEERGGKGAGAKIWSQKTIRIDVEDRELAEVRRTTGKTFYQCWAVPVYLVLHHFGL